MPFAVDWTSAVRLSDALEYVLIGHGEGGLMGRHYETWGCVRADPHTGDLDPLIRRRLDDNRVGDGEGDDDTCCYPEGPLPDGLRPYVCDGFERVRLVDLRELQLCRFDDLESMLVAGGLSTSQTNSFRRWTREGGNH